MTPVGKPAIGTQNKLTCFPKVIRLLLFVKKMRRVCLELDTEVFILFRRASLFKVFVKCCVFNVSQVINSHDIIVRLTDNSSWQLTSGAHLPAVNY